MTMHPRCLANCDLDHSCEELSIDAQSAGIASCSMCTHLFLRRYSKTGDAATS